MEFKTGFDRKFIGHTEYRILNRMFRELNHQGLSYIERETERMLEVLRRKCSNVEVTWREVFLAFIWSFEADLIKDYVSDLKQITVT